MTQISKSVFRVPITNDRRNTLRNPACKEEETEIREERRGAERERKKEGYYIIDRRNTLRSLILRVEGIQWS